MYVSCSTAAKDPDLSERTMFLEKRSLQHLTWTLYKITSVSILENFSILYVHQIVSVAHHRPSSQSRHVVEYVGKWRP